jgi:hypothetical protein
MGMTGAARGRGPAEGVTFAAQWDMLARGWADIGQGVVLPEQFTARFTVKDDHTIEMDIATEDGVPVCNGVHVLRHPGRPSLTGNELRRTTRSRSDRYASVFHSSDVVVTPP